MEQYIENPNLPQKKIRAVLTDYRISLPSRQNLVKNGVLPILTTPLPNVMTAVHGHPDMMIHHIHGNIFVCEPSVHAYYQSHLSDARIICGSSVLNKHYPYDIAYNIARVGKYAFHKLQYTDKIIYEYLQRFGVTLINVNQGYSKCSICVLNDHAVITADHGIATVCDTHNIDVLLINPGHIKLPGLDYGFIGGCCGLISPDILAVNGNLIVHPDYLKIQDFCEKHGVKLYPLHNGITEDIGSIIPLFYE